MNIVDILLAKRGGEALNEEQINFFIESYTAGTVTDEQASALLMAIYFQGLNTSELATWTKAMIDSGERLDLSSLSAPTVDKHSTGGVGDKVSLVLAPLVAACGAAVPQLSGRGLGHTGGTLDKLESISGFNVNLTASEIVSQLDNIGVVICAATENLAPADKKLYALRDVTATVESIPLISSSIMSKKIAEGTESLVLDVKVGSGAFMKTLDLATELAETMVAIGKEHSVNTAAMLTNMDLPLGNTAGNALEVEETLECLAGGGPSDLREITLALAQEMLELAGVSADPANVLDSGKAMDSWRKMILAQSGDPDAPLPTTDIVEVMTAGDFGCSSSAPYLANLDAYALGIAAWRLGAGRSKKSEPVSFPAGIRWLAKPGDEMTHKMTAEQPLLELYTEDEKLLPLAKADLFGDSDAEAHPPIVFAKNPTAGAELIHKKIK